MINAKKETKGQTKIKP